MFVAAAIGWLHALGWKSEAKRMLVDYRCVDDLHTRSQRECQRLTRQVAELMHTHRQEVTQYETQIRDNSEAAERREELLRAERDELKEQVTDDGHWKKQFAEQRDRYEAKLADATKLVKQLGDDLVAMQARYAVRRVKASVRTTGEKCQHNFITFHDSRARKDRRIRLTDFQLKQFREIAERNKQDVKGK